MSHIRTFAFFLLLIIFTTSCFSSRHKDEEPILMSINIVDRNGLTETITNKDRLTQYENTDFLCAQPYQKVLRIYKKDCAGNSHAYVHTYYENGLPRQYLEVLNNRAFGLYQEWYENGTLKLQAHIIGGIADLTPCAEKSWQFDGCAKAWDENGNLETEISYEHGILEGDSIYYHANGIIWKKIPFSKNLANGTAEYYLENGQLLQTITFKNGLREGSALRFWNPEKIASDEVFCKGLLMQGRYYDLNGFLITEVKDGEGFRASFGKTSVYEMQEFHEGLLNGEVKVFDDSGNLTHLYHVENALKHGEEVEYSCRKNTTELQPKLSITWYKGKIQGYVKTWYDNGNIESQREMNNNKKNGMATAWYKDGSLMLIEEYDHDHLLKGEYYKKGDRDPISEIKGGNGIATIYDGEGHFIRRINYYNGRPQD